MTFGCRRALADAGGVDGPAGAVVEQPRAVGIGVRRAVEVGADPVAGAVVLGGVEDARLDTGAPQTEA